MRFSERTHPALYRIAKGEPIKFNPFGGDKKANAAKRFINKFVIEESERNGVECLYCCQTFLEDAGINWPKICNEVISPGNYCIVHKNDVHFLKINNESEAVNASGYALSFRGHDVLWVCEFSAGKIKVLYDNAEVFIKNKKVDLSMFIQMPIMVVMFKEYSIIGSRRLKPMTKLKDFHCKYDNQTDVDIQILDMNWYTRSLQSHPFMVRGHWRQQPHGKGRKEKKLKYIHPYWKDGYTKGAYKEE